VIGEHLLIIESNLVCGGQATHV